MCWRAVQKWSPKIEGGFKGNYFVWVVLGVVYFLFWFCFGFVLCCWVFLGFFSDADRSWKDQLFVLYFQPVLYLLEIASTRQSPMAQVI